MSARSVIWVTGTVLLALTTACDEQRSRVDGVANTFDGEVAPDGAVPSDAAPDAGPPPDVGLPPDAEPPPDPASCVVAPDVELVNTQSPRGVNLHVDGVDLYYGAPSEDGWPRSVRHRDGQPAAGPTDTLVSIFREQMLLLRPDGAGGQRWIYRDGAGDTYLGDGYAPLFPPVRLHWVADGRALWNDDAGALHLWNRGDDRVVLEPGLSPPLAMMGPDLAAWQTDTGIAGVRFDPLEPFDLPLENAPRALWVDGDRVWWTTPEAVGRFDARTAERAAVPLAGCEAIAARGPIGLAVCYVDGGMTATRLTPVGEQMRNTVVDRATHIAAPVMDDRGWIAWAAWDEPGAWCQPMDPDTPPTGRVMWGPIDGDIDVVGAMSWGCHCCGAIWDVAKLQAGDDMLVWNYAATFDAGTLGIARRVCD